MTWKAIGLVAPPHDPAVAGPFFQALLGEGWEVRAYRSGTDVPDEVAAGTEVIIAALAPADAALIDRCPKLRLIQVPGHGYDHVDVEHARVRGVPVCTVASSGAEAHTVAEWTIIMAGATSRRLVDGHNGLRRGTWTNLELMQGGLFELAGKTIGILGLGRIGAEVARRARAFDMTVVYHDPVRRSSEDENALDVTYRPFDELLATADVVTIHVPAGPKTAGLIGARELGLMKPTAILINTARGTIVDHDALVSALRDGRIRAAAIDVYDPEPPSPDDPLLALPNVTLSPHLAGVTAESLMRILNAAAANCNRLRDGEPLHDPILEGSAH